MQLGPAAPATAAVATILAEAMRGPAYDHLRTQLQLGYDVDVIPCSHAGACGVAVSVAGAADAAGRCRRAVPDFLAAFGRDLGAMSKSEFNDLRASAGMEMVRTLCILRVLRSTGHVCCGQQRVATGGRPPCQCIFQCLTGRCLNRAVLPGRTDTCCLAWYHVKDGCAGPLAASGRGCVPDMRHGRCVQPSTVSDLTSEVDDAWPRIMDDTAAFDRIAREAAATRACTLKDARKAFNAHLSPSSRQRRCLTVEVHIGPEAAGHDGGAGEVSRGGIGGTAGGTSAGAAPRGRSEVGTQRPGVECGVKQHVLRQRRAAGRGGPHAGAAMHADAGPGIAVTGDGSESDSGTVSLGWEGREAVGITSLRRWQDGLARFPACRN